MRNSALALAIFVGLAGKLHSQEFEVASIRPIELTETRSCMQRMVEHVNAPGRFHDCNNLVPFLVRAFGLPASQIQGLDKIAAAFYEVQATYTPGASETQIRAMLMALIKQRFDLKSHIENRETTIHELSVAPGGHKLIEVDTGTAPPKMSDFQKLGMRPDGLPEIPSVPSRIVFMSDKTDMRGRGTLVPIAKLIDFLSNDLRTPVLDRTGLTAIYNFTLEFANSNSSVFQQMVPPPTGASVSNQAPDNAAADPARFPPLTTALRNQLGLVLEKKKGPATFLIIDSIAPKPKEN
jgi:uncharacterized protein (TIGR03435 family)